MKNILRKFFFWSMEVLSLLLILTVPGWYILTALDLITRTSMILEHLPKKKCGITRQKSETRCTWRWLWGWRRNDEFLSYFLCFSIGLYENAPLVSFMIPNINITFNGWNIMCEKFMNIYPDGQCTKKIRKEKEIKTRLSFILWNNFFRVTFLLFFFFTVELTL